MREKELRLALVCYGGISLAVYMHGITSEIWRMARASRAYHDGAAAPDDSAAVYHALLAEIAEVSDIRLRVFVDIVAGASAGGINGLFLAHAAATGQSLDPLTRMWLEQADIEADDLARTPEGWVRVKADAGAGYVKQAEVRSPLDYRAVFQKTGEGWKLIAFVAGD